MAFVEELQGERPLETPETFLEMIEKQEEELKLKETSTNLLQFMREKKEEKYRQRMEKVEARKRDIERRKAKRDEEKRERGGSKKNKDYGNLIKNYRLIDQVFEYNLVSSFFAKCWTSLMTFERELAF